LKKFNLIALIPARSGSERIKNKNIVSLNNHPLIAYAINSAKKSKIFDSVIVSTDSRYYAKIAKYYGAEVPFLRPKKFSKSTSPDYEWVNYTIKRLQRMNRSFSHFFILRPTNPFRTEKNIKDAWNLFLKYKNYDSLRAVELCKQHPGKMWKIKKTKILPFLNEQKINSQPSYNCQYKSLSKIFIQNGFVEISKINVLKKYKTITGKKIIPYFSEESKSFDINYKKDLDYIEYLLLKKNIFLPLFKIKSYKK
jgi:N-acylneuraminate cytidylyltransferase